MILNTRLWTRWHIPIVDDELITRYAYAESKLKEASRRELESLGLDWQSFYKMKSDVLEAMTDEPVETEFGTVGRRERGMILYKKITETERNYQLTYKERET